MGLLATGTIAVQPNRSAHVVNNIVLSDSIIREVSEIIPSSGTGSDYFLLGKKVSTKGKNEAKDFEISPTQLRVGVSSVLVSGVAIKDISLYDIDGLRIYEVVKHSEHTASVEFSKPGIYVIRVYDGSRFYSELVTVN